MTSPAAAAENGEREIAGWLLAAGLLGAVVFGYLMPLTGYFTAMPGDLADARYNSMTLEHAYRVVTGRAAGLWSPDVYYPFTGVLAFSDTNFGGAASYVLARLAGLPREHAFNVWFVVGTLLNFASALYVIRRLGLGTAAAALGAFFFTVALPVPAQDGHAQLVHRFAAPLAALSLWQMFERRRLVCSACVAFFTVWQFYCSVYLGVFLVYLLAALAAAILVVRRPLDWPQWRGNLLAEPGWTKLAGAGLLAASLLAFAYLGINHYLASRAYGAPGWDSGYISLYLPRPVSYIMADIHPLLAWGSEMWMWGRHEHQLFIGFGAIVLIASAIALASRGGASSAALTRVMLIAVAILAVGTLWVGHVSLYHLISWLPGIKAIRIVSRLILIMLVPLSVLVALGADALWRRFGHGMRAAPVLGCITALVIAEPLTVDRIHVPIAHWQARLNAVKALLPAELPKDAILLVRTGSTNESVQTLAELDGMLLGQDLGRPALNGVTPFSPPGYRLRRCVPATERLEGYSSYMGGIDIAAYARRVVVLDLDPCPTTP